MPTPILANTIAALRKAIETPTLANARGLEIHLTQMNFNRVVFGRFNQKSSIDAASESDRGITERLSNAFDASLTAARLLAGVAKSDKSLTPRVAVERFLNPNTGDAEWTPQFASIMFPKPVIQFWKEGDEEKNRFRKFNPGDGLATVLIRDFGLGIARDRMPKTILDLNSDDKLKTFEAIGQFGHGGSSALAFCESCLVISQPRFGQVGDEFYWTLIYPEREQGDSKQSLLRKWFADADGLPLVASTTDFPSLAGALPGTSIWHFGYNRGGWINRIAGPEQSNAWGRLGRMFFSYPLPFEVHGEFARADSQIGRRTIKGAYFRLLEKGSGPDITEYRSGEKSEQLIVEGNSYGQFSLFVFVLKNYSDVRNYVDRAHPIVITLNGQNHGELTPTMLTSANLPELAASTVIEIRLDGLEEEALGEIISNSREAPKNTAFTRAVKERVIELLKEDEALADIEKHRQDAKVQQSSADLNQRITKFLSNILSNAVAQPTVTVGGTAPGSGGGGVGTSRPEIPAADPPKILEFISERPLFVPGGGAFLAKFKSDARPPRYSFHGDAPRCFVSLELKPGNLSNRLSVTGKGDINRRGYGSVTLTCTEDSKNPITDPIVLGQLIIAIQCTDGRTLRAKLDVGVRPKPAENQRRRKQDIQPKIIFCAPGTEDRDAIATLIGEKEVHPFSTYLQKYRDSLNVPEVDCAYWGEASDREGVSYLIVEINAAHPQLKKLFQACKTAEERTDAKERFVRDAVLDCYQHCFKLEDIPEIVQEQVMTEPDDAKRAAETCLNFDKALRIAINEREKSRTA